MLKKPKKWAFDKHVHIYMYILWLVRLLNVNSHLSDWHIYELSLFVGLYCFYVSVCFIMQRNNRFYDIHCYFHLLGYSSLSMWNNICVNTPVFVWCEGEFMKHCQLICVVFTSDLNVERYLGLALSLLLTCISKKIAHF